MEKNINFKSTYLETRYKQEIDIVEELVRIKGYDKVLKLLILKKAKIKQTLNNKQKLFHFASEIYGIKGLY